MNTKYQELISSFESVDRWKTRSLADSLNGFHIKIHDYDLKNLLVTFSWWDGTDSWEDDLSFEDFSMRFEPWY